MATQTAMSLSFVSPNGGDANGRHQNMRNLPLRYKILLALCRIADFTRIRDFAWWTASDMVHLLIGMLLTGTLVGALTCLAYFFDSGILTILSFVIFGFANFIFFTCPILYPIRTEKDIKMTMYEKAWKKMCNTEIDPPRFRRAVKDINNRIAAVTGKAYGLWGFSFHQCKLDERHKLIEQLLEVVSCGHYEKKLSSFADYAMQLRSASNNAESRQIVDDMLTAYTSALNEMEDLETIWEWSLSSYGINGISLCLNSMEYVSEIAEKFNIVSALDAYYAGVPADDIVA